MTRLQMHQASTLCRIATCHAEHESFAKHACVACLYRMTHVNSVLYFCCGRLFGRQAAAVRQWHCTALHSTAVHRTALHSTVQHCTALHSVPHSTASYFGKPGSLSQLTGQNGAWLGGLLQTEFCTPMEPHLCSGRAAAAATAARHLSGHLSN